MLYDILQFYLERPDFIIPLIIEHLQISLIAITFATIIGISLGILISEKRKTSSWILGIVSFIYTIPSISLLGLLIPITGIGNNSAILALSVYALLPIIRNTYTGLTSVDDTILEAAKSMGSTRFQILYKIKFPLALPIVISGFRSMVVMTIALAGIASFIGAGGLGVAIYRGITTNNMAMTIAGSIAVALMALLSDFIIGCFEHRLQRHHRRTHKKLKPIVISICAVFILIISLFFSQQKSKDTIHIATKPMTEGLILGEVLKQLIEHKSDLDVELTKGVGGGSSNIHPAMLKGDFDLYSEYTGTAWSFILKETSIPQQDDLYKKLVAQYEQQYKLTWKGLYGFNNSYGIAIRKDFAKKYNIKSYADLAAISDSLLFGAEYDFYERDDGYDAMVSTYHFKFKNTIDLELGLKYAALQEQKVDAIIVYNTDGELRNENFVSLEDNLNFFNKYYAGSVIRMDTLKKYPELESILMMLENKITDKEMSRMNSEVNIDKKTEAEVASDFLQRAKLVEGQYE